MPCCTAVGGVAELLEDGALGGLVPSGDAAIRARIVEHYGARRMIAEMDALYRRLVNERKRG